MATIDADQIREMNDPLIMRKPVGGFFSSMFFDKRPPKLHTSDLIDLDIWKGGRRVAPYVKVKDKAVPFDRIKGTTSAVKLPCIKLKRTLEPADMLNRTLGESIYSSKTVGERLAETMAQDLIDLDDAIGRNEEIQAAQAIIDGLILIKGDDIDASIDMQRDATLIVAIGTLPTAGWTTANDILGDLRFLRRRVFLSSGRSPNIVIMGQAAAEIFLNNTKIASVLDNRRLNGGAVTLPDGSVLENAIYYGHVGGFEFYEYNELFDDPFNNNTPTLVMNSKKIVLASAGARCTRHYAPILDLKSMMAERRFAKWVDLEDPSVRELIMQSRPAMICEETDAFVTATVLP